MPRLRVGLTALLIVSCIDIEAVADNAPDAGRVTFLTSCDTAVRADFNRAVALLYSFEYPASEAAEYCAGEELKPRFEVATLECGLRRPELAGTETNDRGGRAWVMERSAVSERSAELLGIDEERLDHFALQIEAVRQQLSDLM